MLFGKKPVGTLSYMGGVPAVLEQFCWSWGQLVAHTQEALCNELQYVHLTRATMSDHAPARNSLCANFLGDWLFMTDTDHAFEPDLVVRLHHYLQTEDLDVVSGLYQFKTPPHLPVLFSWPQDGTEGGLFLIGDWSREPALIEVGSTGGGCLLIRRRLLERIGKELKEAPFDRIHPFSEDHSFFLRCKRLGVPLNCAIHVHSHHLRVHPVTLADYNKDEVSLADHLPTAGKK